MIQSLSTDGSKGGRLCNSTAALLLPGEARPDMARVTPGRECLIAISSTFERLRFYPSLAMGWLDYRLHEYKVGRSRITGDDAHWDSRWPYEEEDAPVQGAVAKGGGVEPTRGIEPRTPSLRVKCSTS